MRRALALFAALLLTGCGDVGRYQLAGAGPVLYRLDTKTGVIERCFAARAQAACGVNVGDEVAHMPTKPAWEAAPRVEGAPGR